MLFIVLKKKLDTFMEHLLLILYHF